MVVEAAGAWTEVYSGSQQYWPQAFNNVLLGRWKKIEAGFGRAVLVISGVRRFRRIPRSSRLHPSSSLEPFTEMPRAAPTRSFWRNRP